MLKVGLTGGIASGKTSVANWFGQRGVTVFDADKTVHTLMEEDALISAVRREFGPEYIENGKINRVLLASQVFTDHSSKRRLEELIHPLVLENMNKQCQKAEQRKEKIILLDIPLLFEAGWDKYSDEIWVVYVPFDTQVQRLMNRNGLTLEEAHQRINSQMKLDEKAKKADRVIDNSDSWEDTEDQLRSLCNKLSLDLICL